MKGEFSNLEDFYTIPLELPVSTTATLAQFVMHVVKLQSQLEPINSDVIFSFYFVFSLNTFLINLIIAVFQLTFLVFFKNR